MTPRDLIGVRWHHQGRDPVLGVDCIGVVIVYLRSLGYTINDRTDYTHDPDGSLLAEATRVLGAPVALGAGAGNFIQPGDVVLMEFSRHKPRHAAIVGDHPHGPTIIHADNKAGKVVEHRADEQWKRRVVGVWRVAA
jgi:cell wall-associated NlpC family hydrolase